MATQRRMSRRKFLLVAGGATILAAGGGVASATYEPAVHLSESSYGGNGTMKDRVLVAYATRAGSTIDVAKAIGEDLAAGGAGVDVLPIRMVKDLHPYRAVVVGSAIRMGKWLPEAVKFVEQHRQALSEMPVAYFTVCLTLSEDTEENRRLVATYLDPVRALVKPVDEAMFAGMLDYSKLSFLFRFMMRKMESPEGDFRDWAAIRAWAANLRPRLLSA